MCVRRKDNKGRGAFCTQLARYLSLSLVTDEVCVVAFAYIGAGQVGAEGCVGSVFIHLNGARRA